MIRWKAATALCAVALFVTIGCLPITLKAQRGGGGNQGGGGGGKDAAYDVVPFLPTGVNVTSSYVTDLNETGQAIGFANNSLNSFVLDVSSGVYQPLESGLGGHGLNDLGQIVGFQAVTELTGNPVFLSSPNFAPIVLPLRSGDSSGGGYWINNAGVIIGDSVTTPDPSDPGTWTWHSVVWRVTPSGTGFNVFGPIDLPPLLPSDRTEARGLNEAIADSVQIVGASYDPTGATGGEAVVWTLHLQGDGSFTVSSTDSRGTLGLTGSSWALGLGINILGDICGQSDFQAVIGVPGQSIEALPELSRHLNSEAIDINDAGVCVGRTRVSYRGSLWTDKACLWRDGEVIDLADQIPRNSGWDRLRWGNSITNGGLIAGWGQMDGQEIGFLLVPRP